MGQSEVIASIATFFEIFFFFFASHTPLRSSNTKIAELESSGGIEREQRVFFRYFRYDGQYSLRFSCGLGASSSRCLFWFPLVFAVILTFLSPQFPRKKVFFKVLCFAVSEKQVSENPLFFSPQTLFVFLWAK